MIDFKLMDHQKTALWKSQWNKDLFLAWDPGTGKTCATLQMIRARCAEKNKLLKVLILAPAIVLKNWKDEVEKFTKIPKEYVFVLNKSIAKRTEFMRNLKGFSAVVITNYDAMQDIKFVQSIKDWGPDILVADEVHYCKSYKSKRAKNVSDIARGCSHRYLLTGTPVLNSGQDLWMQYNILDGHLGSAATFPGNFFVFRNTYFEDENAGWANKPGHYPKYVPKEGAYEAIKKRIEGKTIMVKKEECLDLPPLMIQNQYVKLSKEQALAYEEMREEYITWVTKELEKEPRAVVARLAITKVLRLQQIVSGFVKTDDGEVIRFKDVPRLSSLKENLELLVENHKVIVWACFKENYTMIAEVCKELGIEYAEIHGDIKDKASEVKKFEGDPKCRVLIGNQGAGGVGVNLVSASYAIYYSRGFKLGDDIQSEARNYRKGSHIHEKVTRINMVALGTVDETISDALEKKQDIGEQILDFTKLGGKDAKHI